MPPQEVGTLSVACASALLAVLLASFVLVVALSGQLKREHVVRPDERVISAWNTQPWWSLACSFFAAAFGASALTANPEAGATGGYVSVVAYGLANALPYYCLMYFGPRIQAFLHMDGFTVTDFVYKRYGLVMYIITSALSLFFMFIWLTAELTSLGLAFASISPGFYAPAATIATALGVASYALFGGFKGSILTDCIQAPTCMLCVLILLCAILASVKTTLSDWGSLDTRIRGSDISGAVVLILSTTLNQFLDLGSWQRVFASQSRRDAMNGLLVAGSMNFCAQSIMTFFGLYAVVAVAAGKLILISGDDQLAFFSLLNSCHPFFSVIAIIMIVVLAASTIDSIENSMASSMAWAVTARGYSMQWTRLIAFMLIIPAIILATTNQSVLSLFLLSNIFSAAVIPPVFMGLSPRWATSSGALIGFLMGVASIFIIGWSYERDFVKGLKWPLFPYGFTHWTACLTFLVVPVASLVFTIGVSKAEILAFPKSEERQKYLLERLNESSSSMSSSLHA